MEDWKKKEKKKKVKYLLLSLHKVLNFIQPFPELGSMGASAERRQGVLQQKNCWLADQLKFGVGQKYFFPTEDLITRFWLQDQYYSTGVKNSEPYLAVFT